MTTLSPAALYVVDRCTSLTRHGERFVHTLDAGVRETAASRGVDLPHTDDLTAELEAAGLIGRYHVTDTGEEMWFLAPAFQDEAAYDRLETGRV